MNANACYFPLKTTAEIKIVSVADKKKTKAELLSQNLKKCRSLSSECERRHFLHAVVSLAAFILEDAFNICQYRRNFFENVSTTAYNTR